jgi:hypothetical protein
MSQSGTGMQSIAQNADKAADGIQRSGGAAREARGGFNEWFDSTMQIIGNWQQLIAMVGQFVQWIGQARAAAENTARAFTYLAGSTAQAQEQIAKLNNTYAAAAFGSKVVDDTAQHFAMLGKNAQTTQKEIERVGDALAAMGTDGKQMTPVIEGLHKIQEEGRVTKADIDALANDGIASWQALADGMSVAQGHLVTVEEAQKRVNSGAVSGKEAYEDMMRGMMQYSGEAERQSNSLAAEWQRLGDHAAQAFGPIADLLAADLEGINEMIEGTSRLNDALKSVGAALSSFGGMTITAPIMPMYASGGTNLPAGWRIAGEDGPELQYSPGGDTIIPNGADPFSFLGSSALSSVGPIAPMMTQSMQMAAQQITVVAQLHVDGRMVAEQTMPHIAPILRQQFGRRV